MQGFVQNIEELSVENNYFRKVLYTAKSSQLVLMCLMPAEEIGEEVHDLDQFFRIETGQGEAILDGKKTTMKDGWAIMVPAGTKHNIINTSQTEPLKLYTIYSPPDHKDGLIHKTKQDATTGDLPFDGKTTESN